MLAYLLDDLPIHVEIAGTRLQATELLALAQTEGFSVVCFAGLPLSPSSKTRYLVKRLRAALPDVRILVGRWGPPALADESTQALRDTGANLVASTLLETRTYVAGLVEIPRIRFPRHTSRTLRSSSGSRRIEDMAAEAGARKDRAGARPRSHSWCPAWMITSPN